MGIETVLYSKMKQISSTFLKSCIKKFIDCSHGKKNKFISSNYKGNVKPGIFSIDFSIIVRASPHTNILPINLLP